MSYPPKIVLHAPLQDRAALGPFVEQCLLDRVELIAIVGEGCTLLENFVDEIVVGDGRDDSRFIVTTSHPDQSAPEVLEFARSWACKDGRDGVREVRL